MNPMLAEYIVFFLAAFTLIVAVVEINRRLSHHQKRDSGSLKNWVELDTKRADAREERPFVSEDGTEEETHARAKQNGHNGHHAESQKP